MLNNNRFIYKNKDNKYTNGVYKCNRILDGNITIWEMEDGSLIQKSVSDVPNCLTVEQTIRFIETINKYLGEECRITKDDVDDSNAFYLHTNKAVYKLEFFNNVLIENTEFSNMLNINIQTMLNIFAIPVHEVHNQFKLIRHAFYASLYMWDIIKYDEDGNSSVDIYDFCYLPDYQQMVSYLDKYDFKVTQVVRNHLLLKIVALDKYYNILDISLYDFEYGYKYNGEFQDDILNIDDIVRNISTEDYDYEEETHLNDGEDDELFNI